MRPTIREVRPDDWQAWRDVRLRALVDAPDAFGETIERANARTEAEWQSWTAPRADAIRLIAEQDGRAVGMTMLAVDDAHRAHSHLYAMWVDPAVRRSGTARGLVTTALAWARRRAVLTTELRVSERHPPAKALYEAC